MGHYVQRRRRARAAGHDHDLAVRASLGHEAGLTLADDAWAVDELSELAVDRGMKRVGQNGRVVIGR